MVAIDTTRSAAPHFAARLVSGLFSFVTVVSDWNDARVTRNALSNLSAHELEDIGLCRGDIDALILGTKA